MTQFHDELKLKMNELAHLIYRISKDFPKEELYGLSSQIKRATLSVILNYIEGYARGSKRSDKHFLEISYGSLKETKYLLEFSLEEKYLTQENHDKAMILVENIGAMLWGTLSKIKL